MGVTTTKGAYLLAARASGHQSEAADPYYITARFYDTYVGRFLRRRRRSRLARTAFDVRITHARVPS